MYPLRNSCNGYTLIEVMIALMIFIILSAITTMVLFQSFHTKQRIDQQANWLSNLQFAISHLQRDTQQIIERVKTQANMKRGPAFVGEPDYLEFTRTGVMTSDTIWQLSSLNRVAYQCQGHQLIRKVWRLPDPAKQKSYHENILLENLKACKFSYLSNKKQVLSEWRDQSLNRPGKKHDTLLPIAIKLSIKLKGHGNMNLLFILPESFYG